ncbi:hypothetical protein VTK56DRAFT_5258 [Thermocarpiscus australiensis]
MHYIRLLRPPAIQADRREPSLLKIVLTITTDLGDSFLSPREPVHLAVIGAYTERKSGKEELIPVNLTHNSNAPRWQAGMRVLKLEVPLPSQPIETIQIRPSSRQLTALSMSDIYPGKQGLIMAAYADITPQGDAGTSYVGFRSLRLPTSGDVAASQPLQIEEDIGESIARHIWDAGIVTVSLVADICLYKSSSSAETTLPLLRSILHRQDRPLNILELGCGVGVLGIGMARILSSMKPERATSCILMTDLHEAEERARANIARQARGLADASTEVDFEALDWEDGKHGAFGKKVQSRAWDLVVLSDCIYNADMLPLLIKTLSAIHSHSARQSAESEEPVKTDVFLTTKPRHHSEKILMDLMSADGWLVRERTSVPLPVIDGEGQSVEMYLFGMKEQ